MAKGAGKQSDLATAHKMLTGLYVRMLERYNLRLEVLDSLPPERREELQEEFITELFDDNALPPASTLKVIQDFLKNNDVVADVEDVNELGHMTDKMQAQRRMRSRQPLRIVDVDPSDE